MKKFYLMLALATSFGGSFAFGHAGHDKTPGAMDAPHGGVMQGTSELYFELVSDASGVKLYPLTHESKPIALDALKVLATVQLPKKKKEPVKLDPVEDHYEAKIDAKGASHFTLEVVTNYKGKKEKVQFQVEPQS